MAAPETIAAREGEALDLVALRTYLEGQVDCTGGLEVEQFPNGHSNLTYLLRTGGREYVLRRPPLGQVAPKAHDMVREYRVLRAVAPHYPPAPLGILVCEDPAVLGAPFFLMERRRGVVLREGSPENPREISEAFVDALVRLHAIDAARPELRELGRPEGYVERQVRGWAERWQRAKTEDVPAMDRVIRWLAERIPPAAPPTLIHNDYKLDNVMLAADRPERVTAVLDWEMATVGDPLSDLGLTLCYWVWAPAPNAQVPGSPGWFTRDELVERYARGTGLDVGDVGYHEVLGVFKLAVIIQQIFSRYHRGQTRDERFRTFGARARALAETAARLAERKNP